MAREVADETYLKKCRGCGRPITKAVLYKGYVFCSTSCRDAFLAQADRKQP